MSGIQLMNKLSVEVNEIANDLKLLSTHPILANSTTPVNDKIDLLQRYINLASQNIYLYQFMILMVLLF